MPIATPDPWSSGCRRVVVSLPPSVFYAFTTRGVYRYAQVRHDWHLSDEPITTLLRSVKTGSRHFDGLITFLENAEQARPLLGLRIPVVNCCLPLQALTFPSVGPDDAAVGDLAARHLAEKGVRSLAIVGGFHMAFAQRRLEAFKVAADKLGLPLRVIDHSQKNRSGIERTFIEALIALPKPTGIFGVNDWEARSVLRHCRLADLKIPDQVSVLGADNDPSLCEDLIPSLSSIDLATDRIGYEAAKLLDRMMDGERVTDVSVQPGPLLERQSSNRLAVDDAAVSRALRFIHEHSANHIQTAQVVEAVGISQRTLLRRFSALVGWGVAEEIRRVRIDKAKRLLRQTHLSSGEIAESCGFANAGYFAKTFMHVVGMSPASFRRG